MRGRFRQSRWQVFRAPLLIGLLCSIGLIAALIGDDAWDVVSWITLVTPIAMTLLSLARAWKLHRP